MMRFRDRAPTERFIAAHFSHLGPDDCWEWPYRRNRYGYGTTKIDNVTISAHRAMWVFLNGAGTGGLEIDHLCRNRLCIKPDHLELVTKLENWRRGESPTAINSRKTHCSRGHHFNAANTRHANGRRMCRACDVIRNRSYKQRKLENPA